MVLELTEEEKKELEEFRAMKAKKAAEAEAQRQREEYLCMVDDEIDGAIAVLSELSENIADAKKRVIDNFKSIIDLKKDIVKVKDEQRSHTFTNSDGTKRITIGFYCIDGYTDLAEDGIAKVKEYIQSLAKDAESQMLVESVLRLLSKDAKGTLKASRVIQLRKMAEKSGNEMFLEGVKLIEESYRPTISKQFIRAEKKGELGEWKNIPLGMTEA